MEDDRLHPVARDAGRGAAAALIRRRPGRAALAALLAVPPAACGARSIFEPAGPAARSLSHLGWFVVIAFLVATALMWLLIFYVGYRRRGTLLEHAPPDAEGGIRWVLVGGFAVPAVVLAVVFVASLQSMAAFPINHRHGNPEIHVRGHRWWFEVQYRIGGRHHWVTSATEIRIPVGRPVDIALESRDVIHAFWVPQLHGKVDLIPGMVNDIRIQADRPGIYGGQCSEYCGRQHANMRLYVVAEPQEQFDRWLSAERRRAAPPSSPAAERGRKLVEQSACALCHTIRGTAALGGVGPDLTHLASRRTLAGGMLENNVANLHAWITHAQSLKPGAEMPDLPHYTGRELRDMVEYLRGLR